MVVKSHLRGRIGIVIVMTSVIVLAVVLNSMFRCGIPWLSIGIVCSFAIGIGLVFRHVHACGTAFGT